MLVSVSLAVQRQSSGVSAHDSLVKCAGHETTFRTIWRPADLDNKLTEIAESLGDDLKRLKYSGRTITL